MMRVLLALMLASAAALAGCAEDADPASDAAVVDDVAEDVAYVTDTVSGSVQVAVTTPARAFNYGGTFATPFSLADNETGIVLELVWDASNQASEQLDLWVRAEGAGSIPPGSPDDLMVEPTATATGASPLRLVLPADQLGSESYEVLVRAAGPAGAAYEQPYELLMTTFTAELDPEFSALDA